MARDENQAKELRDLIARNVEVIQKIEQRSLQSRSRSERISDKIASFCGSMTFVWLHIIWFAVWLSINWLPLTPKSMQFDKPPFGTLTFIVSLEAIFLSTFILISENREQRMNEGRNELDLQINLIAEQETTKIIKMLAKIQEKLGIEDEETDILADPVDAEELAEAVENQIVKGNEKAI